MNVENLPGEIWLDVPDFEGLYKVSNMGRIYGVIKDTLLTPSKDSATNVYYAKFQHKDSFSSFNLASLVYNTFNKTNYKKVSFRDFDPANCRLDNLYVDTCRVDTYSTEEEIWKELRCLDRNELFEISNFGRIRNKITGKMKKLSTTGGRLYAIFKIQDNVKSFPVGDLVYNTFYGTNVSRVNFKDNNCQNVHLSNLYK